MKCHRYTRFLVCSRGAQTFICGAAILFVTPPLALVIEVFSRQEGVAGGGQGCELAHL